MYRQSQAGAYKTQQIMAASPLDLVILSYDAAIAGCASGDTTRVLQASTSLRTALDFEAAPELSPRLYAIYEFCEECVRKQDFDTAAGLLQELRGAWLEVRRRMAAESAPIVVSSEVRQAPRAAAAFSVAG